MSVERLLSGEGLFNIYQYLQSKPPYGIKEDPKLKHEIETGDPAKAISVYAIEKKDISSEGNQKLAPLLSPFFIRKMCHEMGKIFNCQLCCRKNQFHENETKIKLWRSDISW